MSRRAWIWLAVAAAVILAMAGSAPTVIRKLGLTESARLDGLTLRTREALQLLRARLARDGIPTYVGSTLRTPDGQSALVADGKSATNRSWHLLGRAADLYPIVDGTKDLAGKHVEIYRLMHQRAVEFGFRGLAFNADGTKRYITTSKGKVWDAGHLEFPEGMTWAQAAAEQPARTGVA